MSEQSILNRTRLALSEAGVGVYWRANVGTAWTANESFRIGGQAQAKAFRLCTGDLVLRGARPFDTGLPKGFPDLFGITTITITPDMVGMSIGVFTGLEGKGPTGKVSKFQGFVLDTIKRVGGIAGVFRSPEQALEIVADGTDPQKAILKC